jgi:CTP-dependent riboflavin kinase
MRKIVLAAAVTTSLLSISIQSHASSLVSLSGMQYFAKNCEKKGGTSYVSNDQGRSMKPYSYRDIASTLKHSKTTALLEASMNGQRATEAELDKYLVQTEKAEANKMESAGTLRCQR